MRGLFVSRGALIRVAELAIVALLAAGATTIVSAQGSAARIQACVNESNGSPRIVGPSDACRPHERPLEWGTGGGGLSGVVVVTKTTVARIGRSFDIATTECPAGKVAIGGGARKTTEQAPDATYVDTIMSSSYPVGNPPTGWTASINVTDDRMVVYAVCADAAS